MKKKLLVAAALTALAGSAMAQSAFEGFYGQVGIGYENNSVSSRSLSYSDSADPTQNASGVAGATSSGGGFSSAIGLGYNFSVAPKWLVGFGADYTPTNVTTSNVTYCNDCTGTMNYKVKNRYSVYVMPGYEIDKDKLLYVKAGYSGQSMTIQPQDGGNSQNGNVSGFVAGLGYKQLVDKNIYIFGEGNYYSYSSNTISGQGDTATSNVSLKQTPTAYQFLVGVGYKF